MRYKSDEERLEARRARGREWYYRNKEHCAEYGREYYKRPGRAEQVKLQRLPHNLVLNTAKYRAKRDGLDFNIDLSDIVIPSHCPILGIPIFRSENGRVCNNSPSLDRVLNDKGYIKGNVRVISNKANAMKRDHTLETLEKMIQYIKENSEC